MSQDLLSAIGARLEAQLNAKDTRVRSVEDAVKAQVSANPPAPFTLLPDGTKQFGYAPAAAQADMQPATQAAAQAEIVSDAAAPIAALLSATARIFTANANANVSTGPANPKALEATEPPPDSAPPEAPGQPVVFSAVSAYMEAVFAKPAVATSPVEPSTPSVAAAAEAAPTVAAPAIDAPTVALAAVTAHTLSADEAGKTANTTSAVPTAASTAADTAGSASNATAATIAPPAPTVTSATLASVATAAAVTSPTTAALGYRMLADGTKQFGFAPSGGLVNTVPNKTPPVPAEFGVGATMRRKGVLSDTPITVTRVGDGLVFANFTDEQGTREMPFYPNQMDLLTAAP